MKKGGQRKQINEGLRKINKTNAALKFFNPKAKSTLGNHKQRC